MTHVSTHCGSVGEPETNEPAEIQITIHNHTRMNLAIALKRWPGESDEHWDKRVTKLNKLKHKLYDLAKMSPDDQVYYHVPSYVHPEH